MGALPFSPSLVQPAQEKAYWRLVLRQRGGKQVSSRLIQRRKKLAGITEPTTHYTIPDIQKRIAMAHCQWKNQRRQADKLRQTFLDERITELMNKGHLTNAQAIATLHTREKTRQMYRRISCTLKPRHGKGIPEVIGPGPGNTRIHHTEETAMVLSLIHI